MIRYQKDLTGIDSDMLEGFFVGWETPPTSYRLLSILRSSYAFCLAIDTDTSNVVGFVTAISDGIISAYMPLLEVLPAYQGQGIGKELVARMTERLSHLYMVDVLHDPELAGFYGQCGMTAATGSIMRNYEQQSCPVESDCDRCAAPRCAPPGSGGFCGYMEF